MADKKDLVEAQSFSRRRLLTAFTAGAPGGKELEPAKPLRAVVAGAGLAAGVVIAGLFYGMLKPGLPDGWESNTLILTEDTGARYLALDGTLYPVANATSARMLVDAEDFTVVTTDTSAIGEIPVGPSIGILGAPDDVPAASSLVNTGWTACLSDSDVALAIPGDATAARAGSALVVTGAGGAWVVTDGVRHALPEDPSAVLRALELSSATQVEVDSRWLNLFEEATPLEPLMIPEAGEALDGSELLVGTVVRQDGTDVRYLVTADGELAEMSDVAYQMYLLGSGASMGGEQTVAPGAIATLANAEDPAGAQDWPADPLAAVDPATSCALLVTDADGSPSTALATAAAPPDPSARVIAPRAGALVAAGGAGSEAARELMLVDDAATAYALPEADDEILARLGYVATDVGLVPQTWMQFFAAGPALTVDAARSTPQGEAVSTEPSGEASPEASASPSPDASNTATGEVAVDAPFITSTAGGGQQCEAGTEVFTPETPPALTSLQATEAWERATGAGTVVAVVDSGIDASNKHLADAVVGGVNLVDDGEDPEGRTDLLGHGTAVAGVIASRTVEGSGVVGLAPDADLLSVRAYRGTDDESREAGFGPDAGRIAEGIRWAVDHGATIITVAMSADESSEALEAAVRDAEGAGVLVVASAGNRTTATNTSDSPRYPAAYDGALAVTAVDATGAATADAIHGPHVELAAPGQNVLTATTGGGDCLYAADQASASYATGYASGAAALVAQAHADESPAMWRYRLTATAVRPNADARDDQLGWGIVQPLDAITVAAGEAQRGPAHPTLGTPEPVLAASTTVDITQEESPFALTRDTLLLAGIVGVGVLGSLAVIALGRRSTALAEADAMEAPSAPRDGLLDRTRDDATRPL